MPFTAQQLVDKAWAIKADPSGVRWLAATCLAALNDAQREIVLYLPSAYTLAAIPTLGAGTRQTMAGLSLTTGLQFLDVTRNYDAAGTVPGRAITKVDKAWLDEKRPNWHTETASDVIQHYCLDERDPTAMYVWPPSNAKKAEVIYSAVPTEISAIGNNIVLADIYANAMTYYLLLRLTMTNKPGQVNPGVAQGWYSLFLQALGVKDQRTKTNDRKDTP